MRYLIRLVTPKGGTVLDPFHGSGSTGKALVRENVVNHKNYKYIGIDLSEEYLSISADRIEYAKRLMRDYPEGYAKCKLKHPSWTQEDFYWNSKEVIDELKKNGFESTNYYSRIIEISQAFFSKKKHMHYLCIQKTI